MLLRNFGKTLKTIWLTSLNPWILILNYLRVKKTVFRQKLKQKNVTVNVSVQYL